jgi:hypothetical protein
MTYPSQLIDWLMEDGLVAERDFHNEVCSRCKGEGVLKGYPGVYTSDDFASGEVDLDDYLEHRRTCDKCEGLRVVKVLSREAEERPAVAENIRDYYETEAIYDMERRMGA